MRLNPFSKYVRVIRKVSRVISYQGTSVRKSQGQCSQASYQTPYIDEAQSDAEIRSQLLTLPEFKVRWVIDGDTIIASKGRQEIKVRLDSIDCPEDGQDWGDTAKSGLIKLIGGQIVRLEKHGIDSHGRTVATLYVWHDQKNEWLNVSERMVTLGHAWVMRLFYKHLPKDRQSKLNQLERWAKTNNVGLWKSSNPIPPWEWRKSD